ncbi:TRAP transporter small permease subunit [Chloroflexota bacterium]
MESVVRFVDSISKFSGKIVRWACVILIIVVVYEVVARYVFNAPTIWGYETGTMLGATIVAMGWAYTHWRHGHVRIDLFYSRLSTKGKAIVDVVCAIVMLFPLLIVLMYGAFEHLKFAIKMGETLSESYWYPPAAPIRAVVLLGLFMFFLQSVAQFIRDLNMAIRNKSYA